MNHSIIRFVQNTNEFSVTQKQVTSEPHTTITICFLSMSL